MGDKTTRERIKRAARRLFALHGIEGVSVRDIAQASGSRNPASLNYHFGSKEELLRQLVGDALEVANARWDGALRALEEVGGPRSVREVVEILVRHGLSPASETEEPTSARFLAMLLHTRREQVAETLRGFRFSAYDRAMGHVLRLLSDMPPAVKRQRVIFFFWSLTSVLATYEAAVAKGIRPDSLWAAVDPLSNFVDAAVGMLEARSDEGLAVADPPALRIPGEGGQAFRAMADGGSDASRTVLPGNRGP